ncbi:hypothetical protein L914_15221 [Phytophthora nicotianae]|uniref:Uncharacterized protein n=1 Tax=Phytophthora nicotianae TaxID=4792 RepID=W2MQ43_PHYNI|nr:hypothetical protein L914_15221 [Phytophthora nicotianae]
MSDNLMIHAVFHTSWLKKNQKDANRRQKASKDNSSKLS